MSAPSTTTIPSTPLPTRAVWLACLAAVLLPLAAVPAVFAAEDYRTVVVAEPYLELRTGPGRGYPVFHVVERGDSVDIIRRRTTWFEVQDARGKRGWVSRAELNRTLQLNGEPTSFEPARIEDFTNAKWETGALGGDFGGANVFSMYGSYSVNPNVSFELWGSQILGNFSNGWMGSVNVVHEAWPEWRVSPFFTLGAGLIRTEPKSTIVTSEDRTDQIGHVGAGFRVYAGRRFLLRAEYKSYVVFTSRNENEEVEEWKVGFAFFF